MKRSCYNFICIIMLFSCYFFLPGCRKEPGPGQPDLFVPGKLAEIREYLEEGPPGTEQPDTRSLSNVYLFNQQSQLWVHVAFETFLSNDTLSVDTFFYDNVHRVDKINSTTYTSNPSRKFRYSIRQLSYYNTGQIQEIEKTNYSLSSPGPGQPSTTLSYSYQDTVVRLIITTPGQATADSLFYIYDRKGNLHREQSRLRNVYFTLRKYGLYDNGPNLTRLFNMNIYLPIKPLTFGQLISAEADYPPFDSPNNYRAKEVVDLNFSNRSISFVYENVYDSTGAIKSITERSPQYPTWKRRVFEYVYATDNTSKARLSTSE